MKQISKKIVMFLLMLTLLISVMGYSYGLFDVYAETYEDEGEECQYGNNLKHIEKLVYSFIDTNKNFSESKWKNHSIGGEKALFDSTGWSCERWNRLY